ncbi:PTS sugar transporter subunit IIA [Rivihabitans pingtungensis]|jgi:PTS system ascorbate-specific IIA component|uniref:PTS system ascorbate-specific IIA component n=1 Tax=Rivihabitans pingtungensis TaxID=1054498 RepID=A0A318KQY5_9NEIS|nr:PTS fructose transporter subunit IIA [Rivihabitans pingtungensis]PXX79198.1 PTS system ascorbate-specific IIA component [Rivihabitans pingtungensis]
MVGILIVTHGNLGVTLAECAQHILQRELPHLAVMAVDKNDDPDRKLAEARELVRGLDDGSGVLLLSDIFGGTPSNIASRLIEPGRIEAVAGVSLPMLVRSLCYAGQPLETVVSKAVTGGLEGVMYIVPGDAHGASAS